MSRGTQTEIVRTSTPTIAHTCPPLDKSMSPVPQTVSSIPSAEAESPPEKELFSEEQLLSVEVSHIEKWPLPKEEPEEGSILETEPGSEIQLLSELELLQEERSSEAEPTYTTDPFPDVEPPSQMESASETGLFSEPPSQADDGDITYCPSQGESFERYFGILVQIFVSRLQLLS